jgi:hypothetical protein
MRRSNFALRLPPSLLEELRKAAELEGVALNKLIKVAVPEKVSALRTEEYFRERGAEQIAPKPCGFLQRQERAIPRWKGTNFQQSGRRNPAGKRRMGEIQSGSTDRRKGSFLSEPHSPVCFLCVDGR